jgi:hypothetical protein
MDDEQETFLGEALDLCNEIATDSEKHRDVPRELLSPVR